MKTVLGWGALAFVAWWVVVQPNDAAHLVSNTGNWLKASAAGLSNFFASL